MGDLVAAGRELETLANSGDSFYLDLSNLYSAGMLIYQGDFAEAVRQLHDKPISEAQTASLVVAYFDLLIRAEIALNEQVQPQACLPRLESLSQETDHPEVLRDIGLLAIALGDLSLPSRLLEKMIAAEKGQNSAFLDCAINTLSGAIELAAGHVDIAIEKEQRATLYPLRALPYFILGRAHEAKADWGDAITAYHGYLGPNLKGIVLRDEFPGNWVVCNLYLARAYAKMGDTKDSREYYDKFLKLWDGADANLAAIREARAERANLH